MSSGQIVDALPHSGNLAVEDMRVLWQGAPLGMPFPPLQRRRRDFATSLLLAVFLFRAYVPVGFMPGSGTPFLLEMCPGFQVQMPAHHMHHPMGGHAHVEDCPFGSVPVVGPISHAIAFEPAGPIVAPAVIAFEPLRLGVRLQRAHQPRGPPALV
jgi:hypothetical protein